MTILDTAEHKNPKTKEITQAVSQSPEFAQLNSELIKGNQEWGMQHAISLMIKAIMSDPIIRSQIQNQVSKSEQSLEGQLLPSKKKKKKKAFAPSFNLIITSLFIMALLSASFYSIKVEYNNLKNNTDKEMHARADELASLIEDQIAINKNLLDSSFSTALHLFNSKRFTISDSDLINFKGINPETQEISDIKLPLWFVDGVQIHNNSTLIDEVYEHTKATVSIFQKTPEGFLRISSNIKNTLNQAELGTIMPDSSPIAEAANQGQTYHGRAYLNNDWFLTVYEPIIDDKKTVGILKVGVKEKDMESIKQVFKSHKFIESGYPVLITKEGDFTIHPTIEGQNAKNTSFHNQLVESNAPYGKLRYIWSNEEGKEVKLQYFKYLSSIDSFVSVTLYEKELHSIVTKIRLMILLVVTIGVGIIYQLMH